MELAGNKSRSGRRVTLVLAAGLVLGGLLTELATFALPVSAARQFFVTTVAATLGPVAIDLQVIALTLGPLIVRLNVLSLVGVVLVAWFARSLL